MLKDILDIANNLLNVVPKNERDVIKVFKHCLIKKELDSARILSDELVDFYEWNEKDNALRDMVKSMYNKTMEYYEINM